MAKPTPNQTPSRIHVFRAGTHVTSAGEKIEFTEADLAATAAAYSPALHEAPLVIGHPKTDDPAYGWGKGFEAEGGDLYVLPDQVNPEFAELVNSGAFKKRSMKWYRPTDAANPAPGVWYPQHVGFLGATPPAIKGLRAVQFADGADLANLVEVEFSQYGERVTARLFRKLRDWLIGQYGQEVADKALDPYAVELLAEEAAQDAAANTYLAPAFAESITEEEPKVTPEQAAALEAENARLKADIDARKAQDEVTRKAGLTAAAVQFSETLISAGKLLPAEKDSVVGLHVLAASAQPVEFGEGDGKATDAPLTRFEALLNALPKRVEFREVAAHEASATSVEFAAPAGHGVDAERLELHSKAVAHQAAHPGTDYLAAVKAVS